MSRPAKAAARWRRSTQLLLISHPRVAGTSLWRAEGDRSAAHHLARAVDPEGHVWTFSLHVRDVARADAEQAIGVKIEAKTWV